MDKALVDPKVMINRFGVVKVGILIPTTIATIFGVLSYLSFGTMEENVLRSLPFDDEFSSMHYSLRSEVYYIHLTPQQVTPIFVAGLKIDSDVCFETPKNEILT